MMEGLIQTPFYFFGIIWYCNGVVIRWCCERGAEMARNGKKCLACSIFIYYKFLPIDISKPLRTSRQNEFCTI